RRPSESPSAFRGRRGERRGPRSGRRRARHGASRGPRRVTSCDDTRRNPGMVDQAKKDRIAFAGGIVAYVGWALYYIRRTSVEHEGRRIFTLWDDAMSSMRYAMNFAGGHGLVWNPGERVMGYSNLGVTLLMVPIHWLPIGRETTSLVFQLINLGVLLGCMAAT